MNPLLIIEVLAESTAAYDRGRKFLSYQQIESLQEYVLISQDDHVVEKFVSRADGSWVYTKVMGIDENAVLSSVNCEMALKDIYARIG